MRARSGPARAWGLALAAVLTFIFFFIIIIVIVAVVIMTPLSIALGAEARGEHLFRFP